MTINDLTRASSIDPETLFAAWVNADTQAVRAAILLDWLQDNLDFSVGALAKQHAAPSATGFTVNVSAGNTWLILTPVAGYAAGTINLPAEPADSDVVRVSCTQAVTTLTVGGNGNTVNGAPTTLAANAFFTLQYDSTLDAWYRVG